MQMQFYAALIISLEGRKMRLSSGIHTENGRRYMLVGCGCCCNAAWCCGSASQSLGASSRRTYMRKSVTVAKVAALTGNARSRVDVRPLVNTRHPSCSKLLRVQSMIPLYWKLPPTPSACSRDLITSTGYVESHDAMPDIPPANINLGIMYELSGSQPNERVSTS